MEAPVVGPASGPKQFDLPSKEFVGYDPKGTTSITGSPLANKTVDSKQPNTTKEETIPAVDQGPTPPEETVTLSSKVSAFARKEQAQRQREQQIAKREQDLADKLAKAEKFEKLQAKIAAKDYSAIEDLGLNSNEIASYEVEKLNSQDPNEIRAKKLEEEIANIKKAQEEREVEEYKHNQALWKNEISEKIKDSTKFPKLAKLKAKGQDAEALVLQLVNDAFEEDGVELTSDKAAGFVEDALKERAKFYQELLDDETTAPADKVLGPPKASTKTITQTMTTTPKTAAASKPFHLMNEHEQLQEAIRRVQAAKLNR